MQKIFCKLILIIFSFLLISCNPDGMDTTELWEKNQSVGDVVTRSGTTFRAGSDPVAQERQWKDAQNRLISGGGLLGKKPMNILEIGQNKNQEKSFASIGLPINPYLWRGSLETISFMPLASADPMGGIIITDWYSGQGNSNERCKLNIFIKGDELKVSNLQVNSFCQVLNNDNGVWIDQPVNIKNNIKLENAILNQAKKIKLSQT